MKRILSLALSAVMIATSIPFAYATNNYDQGTKVEYTATNNENYTITVPALLQPGQSGNVNLEGSWAENRVITVTADKTVTLTNSIKSSDTKVLDIYFEGISEKGNNAKTQTFTEPVSVKSIDNALFGTWSGRFNYNVIPSDIATKAEISVQATDKNGNDLNAKSYVINDNEKDQLLLELKNSNLINNTEEVDALIEVKSDDFDDLADTTFDVSSIAQPGDKVVILHYNEETREWEYISEETVSAEGKVNADFSSYSPIAFVVVKQDGTMAPILMKKIPDGAYYINALTGASYSEIPTTVNDYDLFLCGDYLYIYHSELNANGWATRLATKEFTMSGMALSDLIPNYTFTTKDKTEYGTILSSIGNKNVVSIAHTFQDCSKLISAPDIPQNVQEIDYAFDGCVKLDSIVLPDNLKTIGVCAFNACSSLTNIIIPNSVTHIDNSAFCDCAALKEVIIPNGATRLGNFAFGGCDSLTSVIVPNSVVEMNNAFAYNDNLQTVIFESNSKLEKIDNGAFYECDNLTTITIPGSVKSIDSLAFSYCPNLTTVIIEEGVVNLGTVGGPSGSIFQDCRKLSYVNIPKSVIVIGDSTFNKCTSLGVFYNGSIDDWHAIAFDDTWNIGCNEISVVCSDGTITIPAYGK